MGSYKIEWKKSAVKELRKVPKEAILKILSAVENLSSNHVPPEAKKLIGSKKTHRIRVGDYRIIYEIVRGKLTIKIIRVGHRKDVYKK